MRKPQWCVLSDILNPESPNASVPDRRPDFVLRVADDHPDILDPGSCQCLESVEEDRFVGDRNELLGS